MGLGEAWLLAKWLRVFCRTVLSGDWEAAFRSHYFHVTPDYTICENIQCQPSHRIQNLATDASLQILFDLFVLSWAKGPSMANSL